jgi:methionyl aminopeptidase
LVTETGYEVLTVSAGSPAVPKFVAEFASAQLNSSPAAVSA